MEVILGKDGFIQLKKNESWVDYGCLETVEIVISTETKSVRTVGDGQWRKPRAKVHGYRITGSGLVRYDDDTVTNGFDIANNQIQGVAMEFKIVFRQRDQETYTEIYGFALPVSSTFSAPADFVSNAFELEGYGAPTIGIVPTCDKEIDDYTLDAPDIGFHYTLTINSLVSGTANRYDWRIDGGGIDTEFSSSWTINLADTAQIFGAHTVEVWPVCDNGARGTKTTINFNHSL